MRELPELGEPPAHLTDRQKRIWQELKLASVPGMLRVSDAVFFEITVGLLDSYRHDPDFKVGRLNQLTKCLNQMGFGAVDRIKMGITPAEKKSNPFDIL